MAQLEHQLQFYTEAARRLGNDGSRVSQAKSGCGHWRVEAARGCLLTTCWVPRKLQKRHSIGGTWLKMR